MRSLYPLLSIAKPSFPLKSSIKGYKKHRISLLLFLFLRRRDTKFRKIVSFCILSKASKVVQKKRYEHVSFFGFKRYEEGFARSMRSFYPSFAQDTKLRIRVIIFSFVCEAFILSEGKEGTLKASHTSREASFDQDNGCAQDTKQQQACMRTAHDCNPLPLRGISYHEKKPIFVEKSIKN